MILMDHGVKKDVEHSGLHPLLKAAVDRRRATKLLGDRLPLAACLEAEDDPLERPPIVDPRPTSQPPVTSWRNPTFDVKPDLVTDLPELSLHGQ